MPKVLSNGIQLHYQRVGSGPNLVLLHGLTGNLAVWHLQMVPRLQKAFRVTTYDLRGHGYSDMPPTGYTTGSMAEDLRGLMDALEMDTHNPGDGADAQENGGVSLVGHSFGADVALHFALLYPERVRRVVAIEAGLAAMVHRRKREDWEGWRYWREALAEFGQEVPPEHWYDYEYMLKLSLNIPKVYGPATGRTRKAEPLLRLLHTTTAMEDYEEVDGFTLDRIPEVTTPVLLIYGDNSAFLATHDHLRTHLPNCESVTVPHGKWGHFAPLEQPELLVEHISRFCSPE